MPSKPPRVITGANIPHVATPTPAPVARPITPGNETSIDVRRISNGFVTRESTYSDDGGYQSEETFSKKPPKIAITE